MALYTQFLFSDWWTLLNREYKAIKFYNHHLDNFSVIICLRYNPARYTIDFEKAEEL